MTYTRDQFIERLGKIVANSKRMLLVIPPDGMIEVHSPYFTYEDTQKITHLLQRTSCEWWIKPVSANLIHEDLVKFRIRLFI